MEMLAKVVILVGTTVLIVTAMSIVTAVLTYFLWNWLAPEIFGLKVITFWQALGLNLLCAILFTSHVTHAK